MRKRAPSPFSDSSTILPPCCCTIFRVVSSPSPVPLAPFVLKKLERDYDPTNRSRAIQLLEEANRNDWLITGLIYIDTKQPSLFDLYNLPETPLNRLEPDRMRPAPETIDQVNGMMF